MWDMFSKNGKNQRCQHRAGISHREIGVQLWLKLHSFRWQSSAAGCGLQDRQRERVAWQSQRKVVEYRRASVAAEQGERYGGRFERTLTHNVRGDRHLPRPARWRRRWWFSQAVTSRQVINSALNSQPPEPGPTTKNPA